MVQQVKDPMLSLWWHRFNPRPRNFHMLWGEPKRKKEKKGKKKLQKLTSGYDTKTVSKRLNLDVEIKLLRV